VTDARPPAPVSPEAPAPPPPSDWVVRWAPEVARPGIRVLDLACGRGRHALVLAALGARVTAVDRDADALAALAARARAAGLPPDAIAVECADLERDDVPWPLAGRRFDALVVTNYLWRPRFDDQLALVADGGWLLYETFADGQQHLGRPTQPAFLLRRGELLDRVRAGWRVHAYEDLRLDGPPRCVQRILARKEDPATAG
jgi:SAM-dependent methyltransferase